MNLLFNTGFILVVSGLLFYKRKFLYKRTEPFLVKCMIKYVNTRTKYVWDWRPHLSDFIKYKLDKIMKIDSEMANINSSSTLSDTIFIEEAVEITKHGGFIASRLLELEKIKPLINEKENKGFIKLNKNQVFKLFGNIIDTPWYLKITYLGHSNVKKRVAARKYTVVYKFNEDSSFVFPPYSASQKIKVGFSAPKIKTCTLMTGEYFSPELAKQYAGLECDFYKTSTVDEIIRNYIDFPEDVVVALKNNTVVVNNEK